jgi:competence protein ComEA
MEGRSLLKGGILLVALSVLRIGIDHVRIQEVVLPEGDTDLPHLLEESLDARDDLARRSAPLAPDETLDPNRSGEEELDRLPGIGPSTAQALVADREERGGFARPEDLLRVRGIGPATLAKIRPHLDFSSGVPLAPPGRGFRGGEMRTDREGSGVNMSSRPANPLDQAVSRVDLNHADPEELQSLPGIGPALAQRILESRLRDGPFRSPEDLLRVRGIGPTTLARLRDQVVPGG